MSANKTIKYEGDETKICGCCQRELPLSSFNKRQASKDGRQYYCRECRNIYRRNRYWRIVSIGGGPLDKMHERGHRYYLNSKKKKAMQNGD